MTDTPPPTITKPKTWKRELALAAFVVWLIISWRYFSLENAALVTALGSGYGMASFSLWGFIGAMFGIHHIVQPKA